MAQAIQQASSRQKVSSEQSRTRPEHKRAALEPDAAQQALAFRAILEGASPERLPAELTMSLAPRIGNQAMLELLSRTGQGHERPTPSFPASPPAAEAVEWSGDVAASEMGAPAFSSLSEL